jgi:hypothetical protein
MYIKVHNASDIAHSNQTGCFPALSTSGNKYIMVLVFEVNGNYIDAKSMKKINGLMIKTYLALWNGKTNNTFVGQKSIRRIQRRVQEKFHIQLYPPTTTNKTWWNESFKCLKLLKSNNQRSGQQLLDETMGQINTRNITYPQPPPSVKCCITCISIPIHLRTL